MQNSRLFEIIYILMGRGRVTAKELATRFEVSVRTIYRDLDALSAAGIPVYATQGAGGGIKLSESYILNKSTLSDAEQSEILFALKSLSVVNDTHAHDLLTRLGSLFGKHSDDWIEVDFSDWGQRQKERNVLSMLKSTILQKHVITFRYYGANGSQTNRVAYPVKLIYKTQAWYLQAYDPQKEAFRTFKLFRMADLCVTEDTFSEEVLPKVPSFDEIWGDEPGCVSAKLWFDSCIIWRVFDTLNVQEFSYDSDGSMTADVFLVDDEQLIGFLLSFGIHMRILEPIALRQRMLDQIIQIQNIYTQT